MRRLLLSLGLFLISCPGMSVEGAQLRLALRGKVLDPSRSPLSGARITAVPDRGTSASTVTDGAGDFTLLLDSGHYTIKISAAGFVDVIQQVDVVSDATEPR